MADGKVLYELRADGSLIEHDLDEAQKKVEGKTSTFGAAAKKIGIAVGAGLIAAGGAAIKFGSEFETSMAGASTLFGDAKVNSDDLNKRMLELSSSTGIAANQLGGALYNALSAGVPATDDMSEAIGFLESSTKLAKAGFTDIDTAQGATIKTLNAYKLGVGDAERIQKILIQTQNKGITTVGELGSVLAQVTPTAAAMGVEFEEVGAALATMTAQGTPTAQATTQLNQLIAELGKEGTKASDILKRKTGQSFKDLMGSGKSLAEVVNMLPDGFSANAKAVQELMVQTNKATKKNYTYEEALKALGITGGEVSGELIDMFGSLEAGKAALAIGGKNAETYTENLKAMSTETDVVGEAYDKVTNTSAEKFNRAINEGKNLLIGLYNNGLKPLVNGLFDAYEWLKKNSDILGPIAYILGVLTAAVIAYNVSLSWAAISTGIMTAATSAFGAVLAFVTSPITLIVLAIGALIAIGYLLVQHWDEIKVFCSEIWQSIADFFTGLWQGICDWFTELWDGIVTWWQGLLQSISDFFTGIWQGIKDFFVGIWDAIKAFFLDIWNSLTEENRKWLEGIWQSICKIFEEIKQFFINIWNNIKQFLVDAWNSIKRIAESVFTTIGNFFTDKWNAIKDCIVKVWKAIAGFFTETWGAIKGIAESVFNALSGFFTSIWATITGVFKSAINCIKRSFDDLKSGIMQVWDSIKGIFDGVISFIRNVFTGNWAGAWEAVKQIFSNIVSGLAGIFKAPINWIIDGINFFIRGLNCIKIPSWVPGIGGKGISIGEIPRLKVGMDFVPADDFPAFLHRGEAVLTAEEAERWRGNMPRFGQSSFPQLSGLAFAGLQRPVNQIDLHATIEADGYTLTKVVLRNLDDVRGLDG